MNDFQVKSRAAWVAAIEQAVGRTPASTSTWEGAEEIRKALHPFMGKNANHTLLPTGGGQDFEAVTHSTETGCLDFHVGSRSVYRIKPERLTLVHIPKAPAESFLLLEASPLDPESEIEGDHRQEELVELADRQLLERYVWDRGYIGHDSEGLEIPIPDDARLVVRWLNGKFLLVAKGSLWNGSPKTYSGIHDKMSPDGIRDTILRALV